VGQIQKNSYFNSNTKSLKTNSHNYSYETLIKKVEEKKADEMEMAKKTP